MYEDEEVTTRESFTSRKKSFPILLGRSNRSGVQRKRKTKTRFRFRRHFLPPNGKKRIAENKNAFLKCHFEQKRDFKSLFTSRLDGGGPKMKNENAFLFFVFVGPIGPTLYAAKFYRKKFCRLVLK